jgi:membrane-associated phospholipid phosphatase
VGLRESYDLPRKPPVPYRQWALMLAVPLIALGLWAFVLPRTPAMVAVLAVVLLISVFVGVWRVLSSRALHEPPGRDPVPPRE